jgi:hypothetical protein
VGRVLRRLFSMTDDLIEVVPGRSTSANAGAATDPLPSWNDGPARQSIIGFVAIPSATGRCWSTP